ncbi:MAG: hypothetical protein IT288_16665 [Bdellovibrionales bacterium]|nr:hypothetical protein [Bdellovibrionales bacterium]
MSEDQSQSSSAILTLNDDQLFSQLDNMLQGATLDPNSGSGGSDPAVETFKNLPPDLKNFVTAESALLLVGSLLVNNKRDEALRVANWGLSSTQQILYLNQASTALTVKEIDWAWAIHNSLNNFVRNGRSMVMPMGGGSISAAEVAAEAGNLIPIFQLGSVRYLNRNMTEVQFKAAVIFKVRQAQPRGNDEIIPLFANFVDSFSDEFDLGNLESWEDIALFDLENEIDLSNPDSEDPGDEDFEPTTEILWGEELPSSIAYEQESRQTDFSSSGFRFPETVDVPIIDWESAYWYTVPGFVDIDDFGVLVAEFPCAKSTREAVTLLISQPPDTGWGYTLPGGGLAVRKNIARVAPEVIAENSLGISCPAGALNYRITYQLPPSAWGKETYVSNETTLTATDGGRKVSISTSSRPHSGGRIEGVRNNIV